MENNFEFIQGILFFLYKPTSLKMKRRIEKMFFFQSAEMFLHTANANQGKR